jgi:hypothetical protein
MAASVGAALTFQARRFFFKPMLGIGITAADVIDEFLRQAGNPSDNLTRFEEYDVVGQFVIEFAQGDHDNFHQFVVGTSQGKIGTVHRDRAEQRHRIAVRGFGELDQAIHAYAALSGLEMLIGPNWHPHRLRDFRRSHPPCLSNGAHRLGKYGSVPVFLR